ncbi:flagellar hook assembly protein FlgD [Xylophilus rhododendri]|uniref:Basal-body rod modification protein FlgD n=1 Tax=Xylophilus rhododendri TaxID=2697032 RepID=A0A857J425_9BURK|nr:flagellar hook capping FlgD N-terminal domain-containing protein [Xylophilus rhododendri]QHI97983.1 flagellar hook assembly protein FlgD [Xylophilus rhododendri]
MASTTDALSSTTAYQPTSSLTSTTSTSSSGSTTGTTSAKDQEDRFLKLLVAQLNNQDPMNPMDNAQMTTQIAQINTVSGIEKLNTTVTDLATQMAAMQGIQASALIGHDVLASGNTVSVDSSTNKGSGTFTLDGSASDVSVKVSTAGGVTVGTLNLGSMAAGQHDFDFNSTGYSSADGLKFTVTAANGSASVGSTTMVKGNVASIGSDTTGALTLKFKDGNTAAYTSVKSIL